MSFVVDDRSRAGGKCLCERVQHASQEQVHSLGVQALVAAGHEQRGAFLADFEGGELDLTVSDGVINSPKVEVVRRCDLKLSASIHVKFCALGLLGGPHLVWHG